MTFDELKDYCASKDLDLSNFLVGGCESVEDLEIDFDQSYEEIEEIFNHIGKIDVVENKRIFHYPKVGKDIHTVFYFHKHHLYIKMECSSDNDENPLEETGYTSHDYEAADRFGSNIIDYYEVKPIASKLQFKEVQANLFGPENRNKSFDWLRGYCAINYVDFIKVLDGCRDDDILVENVTDRPEIDIKKVLEEIGEIELISRDWKYFTAVDWHSDELLYWEGQRVCYLKKHNLYVYQKIQSSFDDRTLTECKCYEVHPQSDKALEYVQV